RHGADVLKALALGARAVLTGRLYCWGLAIGGAAGITEVMLNLLADFDVTLALSGFAACNQLDRSVLSKV
ncbi:MAG: alpha-hydroxy-acid oxidizing protein, partial [Acidobacteriaceae bacterium]|nr:alpha-hydroxy-acid oxidizing protein [Acidobacteriaceae bacterium]